ncbi:MAG: caspase family protein [Nitrospinota bacterium]|nr:caspase family protein [Nitrospinota bacterium]
MKPVIGAMFPAMLILTLFAGHAQAQGLWMVTQVEGKASSTGQEGRPQLAPGDSLKSGDQISAAAGASVVIASYEDCGQWRVVGPAKIILPQGPLKAGASLASMGRIEGCGAPEGSVGKDTYAIGAMVLRGSAAGQKLAGKSGAPGAYRALIIGINSYEDPKIPRLNTAVNDASSLRDTLVTRYGFSDVTMLLEEQATGSRIIQELRAMSAKGLETDSALIYYAGHGDLDRITGGGWWIPWDAKAQDPSTYIDNSVVQNYIKAMPARHVLLISDSCFSGSLFGSSRSLPPVIDDKYYSTLYSEKSRWGFTSGNLTPVSDSGSGGHSVFASQLIKALVQNDKPYTTPRELYASAAPVIRNNSEQMPLCNPLKGVGDEGGEFVFIRAGFAPQAAVAPPRAEGAVSERSFRPSKAGVTGKLSVQTDPPGASIALGGAPAGDTFGGALVWESLPVGEYDITASKSGYQDERSKVLVQEGAQSVTLKLAALPVEKAPPADRATAQVEAALTPAGAISAPKPRVLALIDEKINGQRATNTENALLQALIEKGYEPVDPGMIAQLLAGEDALAIRAIEGDIAAAAKIGAANGADIVITGRATPSIGEPIHKINTGQADVSLRAVLCSSAKIIASVNAHGAFAHISPVSAQALAIQKAVAAILQPASGPGLITQIGGYTANQAAGARVIRMVIANVTDLASVSRLKQIVENADRKVESVVSRGWRTPTLELEVRYSSTAEELAKSLDGAKLSGGRSLAVTDYTENGVNAKIGK